MTAWRVQQRDSDRVALAPLLRHLIILTSQHSGDVDPLRQ
jgi:hypothetical protein